MLPGSSYTVSIMVFFGLFNTSPINDILKSFGLKAVPWSRSHARVSVPDSRVIFTPFNLSIISAALQSIPDLRGSYGRWSIALAVSRQNNLPRHVHRSPNTLVLTLAGNFNNFASYTFDRRRPAVAGSRGAGATGHTMTWV